MMMMSSRISRSSHVIRRSIIWSSFCSSSSSSSTRFVQTTSSSRRHNLPLRNPNPSKPFSNFPFSFVTTPLRFFTSDTASKDGTFVEYDDTDDSNDEIEPIELWEEEDEAEPEIGDGGDGGGIDLQNCSWGARVLSIAQEVLLNFGDDIEIFAFKTSPRGYIYVRLDRLSKEYGCPDMEDIESYNRQFKERLDKAGEAGEIPADLALEVSSPGADRLLRVPKDLDRFKDMPMRVKYVEQVDNSKALEKDAVFYLDSIETESGHCTLRLADVKENRDPAAKGRPLSRKRKDWRLKLPFEMVKKVTLYLSY